MQRQEILKSSRVMGCHALSSAVMVSMGEVRGVVLAEWADLSPNPRKCRRIPEHSNASK